MAYCSIFLIFWYILFIWYLCNTRKFQLVPNICYHNCQANNTCNHKGSYLSIQMVNLFEDRFIDLSNDPIFLLNHTVLRQIESLEQFQFINLFICSLRFCIDFQIVKILLFCFPLGVPFRSLKLLEWSIKHNASFLHKYDLIRKLPEFNWIACDNHCLSKHLLSNGLSNLLRSSVI